MTKEKKDTSEEFDEIEDTNNSEENSDENTKDVLEEKLKQQEEEIQEYKEKVQRLQADFDNFRKRSEKEKAEFVKYANEGVILHMLEAYEDLGRALSVDKNQDLREGVELIYKKLTKILKDEGVEEIITKDEKFDPFKHEALLTEANDDYDNNMIIEELQKGYTLNSKVIRYSKVKVCKK
jgi:molecular chaperone GrpE